VRVNKRRTSDEALVTQLGGGRLRLELDNVPLWRGNDVPLRQLISDFATYLYLPRLKDHSVLEMAVVDGVRSLTWRDETFAIAEAYDEVKSRYVGLKAGQAGMPMLDGSTLVVKAEVAAAHIEREAQAAATVPATAGQSPAAPASGPLPGTAVTSEAGPGVVIAPAVRRHFFATVELNPLKVAGSAQQVADEVIRHLNGQPGAKVKVRLEIEAEAPEGYSDAMMRDIMENAATLKFTAADFEEAE
jgi:hypothetical protein